ncbi:Universal stress protein family protein [Fodinibius roseus]|uniref:Universal stress protein family protein n=1 Tax=Fodinibius roseus TaxID=1194090 RepID=A0A1M5KI47_9BACT|nr:universal stress protein [Fodinibius roseus]SHG52395.1 Universal stress protein family protein [Fodinibius roseus]
MQADKDDSSRRRVGNFTVLVPIHKAELFKTLLPSAIEAAKKYNGKVLLLNVIKKPYLASPQKAEEKRPKRTSFLSEGMSMLHQAECKREIQIEISPDISRTIKRIAQMRAVHLIVMGSNGNQRAIFKNEIPYNLQQLACSIMVARGTEKSPFSRVVVFADRLHDVPPMLDHASFLVSSKNPTLHVFHDFQAASLNTELDTFLKQIKKFKTNNPEFSGEITHNCIAETAGDPIEIPAKGKKRSCVLIRYRGHWFQQLITMHKNDPDMVAQSTGLPIFLYKPEKY